MPKKRVKKVKQAKIDGLSNGDIKKIRTAVRRVWAWSHPRRLCEKRAYWHKDGFPRCEQCKKKAPKIFIDHIENVGDVDEGFIKRMFVSSHGLQALCKKCHDFKTKQERFNNKDYY